MEKLKKSETDLLYSIDIGGSKYALCVKPWNHTEGLRWSTTVHGQLVAESEFLESPGIPIFDVLDDSGNALTANMPVYVVEQARRFPEIAFQIVQACALHSYCEELLRSSPLTFYSLIQFALSHKLNENEFLELVQNKQVKQLQYMGIENAKLLLKIERQFASNLIDSFVINSLIELSGNDEILKEIRHIPNSCLSNSTLKFAKEISGGFVPIYLFRRLAPEVTLGNLRQIYRMLRDTINMVRNPDSLRAISDINSLRRLHDRLVANLMRQNMSEHTVSLENKFGSYPVADLPCADGLVPISSWNELVSEGETMRHCIVSYAEEIAQWNYLVMKMEEPERLTIGFKRQHNRWVLDDVCGYCNANSTSEAKDIIQNYIALHMK